MHKSIEETEITIFDTETTGLSPRDGDRVVEIAAIRFKGNDKISTFESLINCSRPVSEAAFAVNKISNAMLKDAPAVESVIPKFLNFIQGSCLCSYNANFDLEFLDNELKILRNNPLEDIIVIDILKMSRRLLPGLERYALWFVAKSLGIQTQQSHRALSDVELARSVFYKLKEILYRKGITDFTQFSHLFAINPHLLESANTLKIAQIQEALNLGFKLKIKYISSTSAEVSEREVIPKEIRTDKGTPYLVGFCNLRQDERMFRIDGILQLEVV